MLDELGVRELVDAWMTELLWVTSLDLASTPRHQLAIEAKLASPDEAVRTRGEFERDIMFMLHGALLSDPYYFGEQDEGTIGWPTGPLFRAQQEGTLSCLSEAGIPGPQVNMTDEALRSWASVAGLSDDGLDELLQECAEYGLTFPGLTSDERDRLLDLQRNYYLNVVATWLAENPDKVVPLP